MSEIIGKRLSRDLEWVMHSRNLIDSIPGLPLSACSAETGFLTREEYENLPDWSTWVQQEQIRLEGKSGWRVGAYFESLVESAFGATDGWSVLGANQTVKRERQTLGAFDLILRSPAGEVQHWELAVKFYLGLPGAESMRDWLGPNQRDTLHRKVERMRSHQLPLSRWEEGRAVLRDMGVEGEVTHRAHLKGGLFLPFERESECVLPPGGMEMGRWAEGSRFETVLLGRKESRWFSREKPDWLGPVVSQQGLRGDEVLARVEGMKKPQMWSELRQSPSGEWVEFWRWFLVPDMWTENGLRSRG